MFMTKNPEYNVYPGMVVDQNGVAALLNVTRRTVRRYCKKGVLPYKKIGKRRYFKISDIERMLVT